MGVKDLSKLIRPSKSSPHFLKDVSGTYDSIVLSVLLHRLYSDIDFAANFHQDPPVDMKFEIWEMLSNMLGSFKIAGKVPVLIADGAFHPGKADENHRRITTREDAMQQFRELH